MQTPYSTNSRMPFMQQHSHDNSFNMSFGQSHSQPFYTSIGNPYNSFPNPRSTAPSLMSINAPANNAMNDYVDQHLQHSQHPQQNRNGIPLSSSTTLDQAPAPDQAKSLGALTVADLTRILQPIQTSIQEIKTTIDHQMGALQNKVQVLENELKKEVTRNEQLTGVIVSMQKSLNMIDADKRVTNLMVNGLPEEEMVDSNDEVLPDDIAKFKYLSHCIGINDIDASIDEFEFSRLGAAVEGKKRVIKINVGTKETRDKICKETKKVKLLPAPWKYVYINKDVHPVYLKENQRIRKKMQELKKVPGFEHESGRVKLENGLLTVDGSTVDQNLFQI